MNLHGKEDPIWPRSVHLVSMWWRSIRDLLESTNFSNNLSAAYLFTETFGMYTGTSTYPEADDPNSDPVPCCTPTCLLNPTSSPCRHNTTLPFVTSENIWWGKHIIIFNPLLWSCDSSVGIVTRLPGGLSVRGRWQEMYLFSKDSGPPVISTRPHTQFGPGYLGRYSDSLWAGLSGDRIPVGAIFPHLYVPVVGPTQPPVQRVPSLFLGSKETGTWR